MDETVFGVLGRRVGWRVGLGEGVRWRVGLGDHPNLGHTPNDTPHTTHLNNTPHNTPHNNNHNTAQHNHNHNHNHNTTQHNRSAFDTCHQVGVWGRGVGGGKAVPHWIGQTRFGPNSVWAKLGLGQTRFWPKSAMTDLTQTTHWNFVKGCEDLSWNHCTSTPQRSETRGIAERAVRRVQEGMSVVLLQSGLDEKWWADSMECYCFLQNVQDLLSDVKTLYKMRFGGSGLAPAWLRPGSGLAPAWLRPGSGGSDRIWPNLIWPSLFGRIWPNRIWPIPHLAKVHLANLIWPNLANFC